jgi:YVTN family beta-propeller protein
LAFPTLRASAAFLTALLMVSPTLGAVARAEQVGGSNGGPALLPTGQYLNATAAPGSTYQRLRTNLRADGTADANGASTTALSPDGSALLVLTSGYNTGFRTPTGQAITIAAIDPITGQPSTTTTGEFEWVYLYDVRGAKPVVKQFIALPNAFQGLAWSPDGTRFFVSGGQDDRVDVFKAQTPGVPSAATLYAADAPWLLLGHDDNQTAPIPKHNGGILKNSLVGKLGVPFGAMTAGVALSADGSTLYAVNLLDFSLSVVDLTSRTVTGEIAFYKPGEKTAVGEYPLWATVLNDASGHTRKVYVTSVRDAQLLVVRGSKFSVVSLGGEPGKSLLSADQKRLYVANPDLDEIDVIDTASDKVTGRISVARAGYPYRGANPNALALSPDGRTLYATLGGENALAVIDVASGTVRGRIPTGWEPSSVSVSADGKKLYVVNTRSNAGPAEFHDYSPGPPPRHYVEEYVYALEKAGLLTIPAPDPTTLAYLSHIVDANNGFPAPPVDSMMAFLHTKIHHVIYIQKENRTYDQILGDLGRGNGDAELTEFPQPITPNNHALAQRFTDLDNFYTSGDVSGDGWDWSQQGHANDWLDKEIPVNYAGGGLYSDGDGVNDFINTALPFVPDGKGIEHERLVSILDPSGGSSILPGSKDIAATQGADDHRAGVTGGYIWDSVLRAGLSVRHYGLYDDGEYYQFGLPFYLPVKRNAQKTHTIQAVPARPSLFGLTDLYYRGWDLSVPDQYRFEEWNAEFDAYVKNGNLPAFESMVLMEDHFGAFASNYGKLNTPTLEMASNDYALGQVVERVSHSPYWKDTAIVVLEDDSQDGPDHVDTHRSVAHVISPWVRGGSVVSTNYNTTTLLRTIEDLLGIDHLGMNDANAHAMSDVFSRTPDMQPYVAIIPGVLCQPPVDPHLVPECHNPFARRTRAVPQLHDGRWWAQQTAGFDFSGPDRVDPVRFNHLLWDGIMGARSKRP